LRKLTAKWDNVSKPAEGICGKNLFIFAGILAGRDPFETLAGISAERFLFRMMLRWKTLPAGDAFLGQRGCISAFGCALPRQRKDFSEEISKPFQKKKDPMDTRFVRQTDLQKLKERDCSFQ
jgi:hypothetical protein